MKRTSTTAVAVAAGMLFGASSVLAADLGGNCCADLEERVAELEATTARKGNRKVSLTISGLVNRMVLAYDSGDNIAPDDPERTRSNTYWGIDNTNTSTRFNLTGQARINATRNAGFNMTIEVNSGARSVTVDQRRAEAAAVCAVQTAGAVPACYAKDDHSLGLRDANVWIEDTKLGRLTLGRLTQPGPQGTIDLGGIGQIAPGTVLVGNGLFFANDTTLSIGNFYDQAGNYNKRIDGIRYNSPTWQGFQLAASYGEASKTREYTTGVHPGVGGDLGNAYAFNIRYANEFNGVRVAAAFGYEVVKYDSIMGGGPARSGDNNRILGVSGSMMHVATGVFLQGGWTQHSLRIADVKGNHWHVAGGITRNWWGIGNTSFYGEYGRGNDMLQVNTAGAIAAPSRLNFWGVGMVQNIDAAAMQIYAGYRNFDASIAGTAMPDKIHVFGAGMRINF